MNKLNRYASFELPSDQSFKSYVTTETRELGPLGLVNIFVGPNNSGKSRLLRALFAYQDIPYTTNNSAANSWHEFLNNVDLKFQQALGPNVTQIGSLDSNYLKDIARPSTSFFSARTPAYQDVKARLQNLQKAHAGNFSYTGRKPNAEAIATRVRDVGEEALRALDNFKPNTEAGDKRRYYIPILRGMRPFDHPQTNVYFSRTNDDYFGSLPENAQIFTGLELYQTLKNKLLGEPDDRQGVKEYEEFLSRRFFGSKQIALIPREGQTNVHIMIGNDRQLPIHSLGDGMQGLLICTFNVFMEKERCLFFIEEPDMCMHPALQRSFLEVLSDFPQHQYFFTSHSNHVLDMTVDYSNISVFHFSKAPDDKDQFDIRVASSRDRRILLDLGVRNSSVFMTNATIWVEGVTDRLYLRRYLKKYAEQLEDTDPEKATKLSILREDYHYSFVEYQGANLTHWTFDSEDQDQLRVKADFVCAHAFVIADGDVSHKKTREGTYHEMLGDRFEILPVKEIENLIPVEVLRQVVAETFDKLRVSTDLIRYENYSREDVALGRYLDSVLDPSLSNNTYATESGTIKSKVTFCKKAIEFMDKEQANWELTPELKKLCHRIYDHILKHNGGYVLQPQEINLKV